MKDVALEAYVCAIESHLSRRRGRPHGLSPPDFALARAWHAAGIPAGAVLAGIDRALRAHPDARSLAACRRFVAAAEPRGPRPRGCLTGPGPAAEALGLLERWRRAVERLGPAPDLTPLLAALRELARRLASGDDEAAPAELRALDARLTAAALARLAASELQALRAQAERAARRRRGRVDEAALDEARRRYVARRARERCGLPTPLA